jgi:ketopantoate hydroxymethyltransferase
MVSWFAYCNAIGVICFLGSLLYGQSDSLSQTLYQAKREGRKIVAVSCYDFTTAALAARAEVDVILVGDSAAQVMLGHESTLPVSMDYMVTVTAAARRGARATLYRLRTCPFFPISPVRQRLSAMRAICD